MQDNIQVTYDHWLSGVGGLTGPLLRSSPILPTSSPMPSTETLPLVRVACEEPSAWVPTA